MNWIQTDNNKYINLDRISQIIISKTDIGFYESVGTLQSLIGVLTASEKTSVNDLMNIVKIKIGE